MKRTKANLSVLALGFVAMQFSCGPKHYHFDRIDDVPKVCSPGQVVEREVTASCGNQHCTCTDDGAWRCISPPCTPPPDGAPHCNPGVSFVDQVRQEGQLCSRRCVCKEQGLHDCGEFDCVDAPDGRGASVPVETIPEACRTVECASPSQLHTKPGDRGAIISECVNADGSAPLTRRVCHPEGHWEETVVQGGGNFVVRSLSSRDPGATVDRELERSWSYQGKDGMTCVPHANGFLDCRVADAEVVDPACWNQARLPNNQIHVISTARELAKYASCKGARAPIDWEHTRLVMLSQRSNDREKLILKIRYFEDRTEVVALFEKRCKERLRAGRRDNGPPVTREYRLLIPMLRDDKDLKARIEHSDGYCLGRP